MILELIRNKGATNTSLVAAILITALYLAIFTTLQLELSGQLNTNVLLATGLTGASLSFLFFLTIFKHVHKLILAADKNKGLSIRDELTNAYNRKYFYEVARIELERAHRHQHALTLAVMDIDNLKEINQQWGEAVGDQVLKQFSDLCAKSSRDTDSLFRFGGDEFLFLLNSTSEEGAKEFILRLHEKSRKLLITHPQGNIKITVSIGYKTLNSEIGELQDLLNAADYALYTAKKNGKNLAIAA
ncbi:MAG: GGDEF domain-containing protein [Gammaproteobacteria bacterium]|nr:GGDEF domain-containing protein [Gammaproteobacteria bacterium]MDH5691612.1 GGDEF domain-containing protein [Gammaproteobacteria bacterium]